MWVANHSRATLRPAPRRAALDPAGSFAPADGGQATCRPAWTRAAPDPGGIMCGCFVLYGLNIFCFPEIYFYLWKIIVNSF
jgi:hypothetical protein